MKIFQKGFNFSQDGPGNRLVYHLQGCNMHCIWCSNPEGMKPDGGINMTIDELFLEIISSKLMFFSGGGVTFTGGEATVQYEELIQLLKKLKENSVHTAIETNGTHPGLNELLEYVDYLIMDFKHYDSDILRKYTGMCNDVIKYNFEINCKKKRQQHIRIPLINGINTECPEGFAEYFSLFDTSCTVFEFLPYHEFGKEKWTDEYLVKDGFVNVDTVNRFKKVFELYGLDITET